MVEHSVYFHPPPAAGALAPRVALHERGGFRRVGIRERLGQHHGQWRDVVLVERGNPVLVLSGLVR